MKELSWRSGIGYNNIRKNREEARDAEIRRLLDMGAVSLPMYPDYLIMNNGDVYSCLRRMVKRLRPGRKQSGYCFVGMTNRDGERKYEMIHRLVAMAFVANDFGYSEVNHKDGDKGNNDFRNLEWVTPKQNISHAVKTGLLRLPQPKLTDEQIIAVAQSTGSCATVAKQYGVSAETVRNIRVRRSKYYKNFFQNLEGVA